MWGNSMQNDDMHSAGSCMASGQPPDDALILRIAQGDTAALEVLYRQTSSSIYGFALSILRDPVAAEDVMQDTFVSVMQSASSYQPSGKPMAWLLTIARNLALNRYKARSAQKRQGDVFALSLDELDDCAPALSSPDDEAMAAELGRSISAFLRTQSEEVRSMFILRYFYCEPVEALAARFHCGESRIKTTLLRTRRKLKEHLIKEGYCEA